MQGGTQVESSWEQAIEKTAAGLRYVVDKWGPESVSFIGSTRCSNEDNYLLMKLARCVVNTGNIDTSDRLTNVPFLEALQEAFGSGNATATLEDILHADFILVAGSDVFNTSPQVASRIIEALNRKATLAVVDPRVTKTSRLANYHLRPFPGFDITWINAMISHLIDEDKVDAGLLRSKTNGFEELRAELEGFSLSRADQITTISSHLLKTVSEHLVEAGNAIIIMGAGIADSQYNKGTARALMNLGLVTGHVGKRGSGMMLVAGDNNTQGAWDVGVVPDYLAGGIPISRSTRSDWARFGLSETPRIGKSYPEILSGISSGETRALYVMGDNLLSCHDNHNVLWKHLSNLEFLAVQDMFPSAMAQSATVVLPVAASFERGGTATNLERRVQRFDPLCEPHPNTRADWEIIAAVSSAMGVDFGFRNVFEVTDEIASVVAPYERIYSERLHKELGGIIWPNNDAGREGETWKATFNTFPTPEHEARDKVDNYPFIMISEMAPSLWGTGSRSSRIHLLTREANRPDLQLNMRDAERCGVKGGWSVRVTSPLGTMETSLAINDELPEGVAYLPVHKIDEQYGQLSKRHLRIRVEAR